MSNFSFILVRQSMPRLSNIAIRAMSLQMALSQAPGTSKAISCNSDLSRSMNFPKFTSFGKDSVLFVHFETNG
jgi:hypothetical protein